MKTESNWIIITNWFAVRPRTTGFLLFLVLSIAAVSVSFLRHHIEREEEQNEMKIILANAHQKIEQSLKNCYTTSISLALTLDNNGVPQHFDTISKKLLKLNPIISAVQLVPNGVIKYIYPLKGNEAAMNLNVLGYNHLRSEAQKSIETQKIYFAGPLKLRQGGIGIVGRLPIYHKNKFWGFTAVIIKLETLLKIAGVNSPDSSKYYFQLSKKDAATAKERFFLRGNTNFSNRYNISQAISDSDWILYIIAKKPFSFYPQIVFRAVLSLIIALLFGIFTTKLLRKPQELSVLLKEQESRLLKHEMKFKSIFDQATIGFAIIDFTSIDILEANKKFYDILEYTFDEIKAKGVSNIIHLNEVDRNFLNTRTKNNNTSDYNLDKQCTTKSGRLIWINLSISPLRETDEKTNTYIVFINDITKRKKTEKRLNSSLKLVTEQNQRLLNFSYIVSHNLRSHTSNIESIISLIESAETEEERSEMMNLLKSVSTSLDETMNHLNEAVSINTNINLDSSPLNLKEYILKTQKILAKQIQLNDASLIIEVSDDTIINYNPGYLESILYNLISNAIRYKHPNRKPIITIKSYKEKEKDILEIADNGIGIDLTKNSDKIFGMYKTFHNHSNTRGIGLFITKNQVQSMGGTITVKSIPNTGSTFKITVK